MPDVTVTDTQERRDRHGGQEASVRDRLEGIANPEMGLIRGVRRVPVPPGEPAVFSYVVEREDWTSLTDGQAMPHEEGGCAFGEEAALVATYGEAIERYCGCVYREATLESGSYADRSDPALDPTAVVNFSARQQASLDADLCGTDDDLSWVAGRNLESGATTAIPAQLVYLSYPPDVEPFVRNPITTGLAAGSSRAMAIRNGLCELVERDAFITYYLTETELPVIDLDTAPPRIRRLADRITGYGLDLTLLDATTDLGIPVAIAVLVDRAARPAVTVAAAGGGDAASVIESALSEALQTRLSSIAHLDHTERSPADIAPEEITSYTERGLIWSVQERISDLDCWIESERATTFGEFAAEDLSAADLVEQVTAAGYDVYGVDVTTRDASALGFTVQRVIAPRLQPLYLAERLRYLGGDRLYRTPVAMGYRETEPTEAELNTLPHPFP